MAISLTQHTSQESAQTTYTTMNANLTALTNKFNGAIANADIASNADIAGSKLADAGVTSRKFKPTMGQDVASGDLSLTNSWQDVAGLTQDLTLATNSTVKVTGVFDFDINSATIAQGRLDYDGSQTTSYAIYEGEATATTRRATVTQVWVVDIDAGTKTIHLEAMSSAGGGTLKQVHSTMTWEVISQ